MSDRREALIFRHLWNDLISEQQVSPVKSPKGFVLGGQPGAGKSNLVGIIRQELNRNVLICRNQQCCLHFWLLLEDPFEQLSGIVKNVDRHGKPALFLIMPDSCLRIIQAKTKAVRRRKSVNNATISYILSLMAMSSVVTIPILKAYKNSMVLTLPNIPLPFQDI